MSRLTLLDIASTCSAELFDVDGEVKPTGISVDSRSVVKGDLFVALPGKNAHGKDYAQEAIQKGACAVLSHERIQGLPCIVVSVDEEYIYRSLLVVLGKIAQMHIKKFSNVLIFGITGSSGKTTTKDILSHILSGFGETISTKMNMNNELGIPLTLFRVTQNTKYLVLEMGARSRGDIEYLTHIVRPNISAVLNVGDAHIQKFGSRDNIAQAKSEIVFPATKAVVLHSDDELVQSMATQSNVDVLTFGYDIDSMIRASDVEICDDGTSVFQLHYKDTVAKINSQLIGEHNVKNILAAVSMAIAAGCDLKKILTQLESPFEISPMRSEVMKNSKDVLILNDSYNANPQSMKAALKTLMSIKTSGRKIAVLGAMHELGSNDYYRQIAEMIVRLNIDIVVTIGNETRQLYLSTIAEGSWNNEIVWKQDASEATSFLINEVRSNDVVLIKASRSLGLEEICDSLMEI